MFNWWPTLLKSEKIFLPSILGLILLFVFGGTVGIVFALALLPRLFNTTPKPEAHWSFKKDLLFALLTGVFFAGLCQYVIGPTVISEGVTTSSDTAEYFWLLHSLGNDNWAEWSHNRYPLPALLADFFSFSGNPHDTWFYSASASMVLVGSGLYLWGKAVGNVSVGLVAGIIALAFPDLALMIRTVTAYPVILGIWTLSAGFSAYSIRHPHPYTLALAGIGTAATFSADPRGLIPGSISLAVSGIAILMYALQNRSVKSTIKRSLLGIALVVAPLYGSWLAYNRLPVSLLSLEAMLEGTIEVSYTRMGLQPPEYRGIRDGYVWGKSMPWDLPQTIKTVQESNKRLNPETPTSNTQIQSVKTRVKPLIPVTFTVGIFGVIFAGSLKTTNFRKWLDLPGKFALLPTIAHLIWFNNVTSYEYSNRFFALATPGLAIILALGLVVLSGRQKTWIHLLIASSLIFIIPNNLNYRSSWRTPVPAQKELQQCLATYYGNYNGPLSQQGENCVKAQSKELKWLNIDWPY